MRTSKVAEVFLCDGWKPKIYPCYYINIGGSDNKQVYLKKFKGIPENFSMNDAKFKKFKVMSSTCKLLLVIMLCFQSEANLLSDEEWRNFVLSLDENGTLILSEKHKDTVLMNFADKEPYKPTYFFIRSRNDTALWKIHKS